MSSRAVERMLEKRKAGISRSQREKDEERRTKHHAAERHRIRAYELVQMLGEITKGRHVEWFRRSSLGHRRRRCRSSTSPKRYEMFKRELARMSDVHRHFNDANASKNDHQGKHKKKDTRKHIKTCPGNHGALKITRITADMRISCDVCFRRQDSQTHAASCRTCNYDVCLECFYGRKMIVIGKKREHKEHIRNLKTFRPSPPPKISAHLFAFAKRAVRAQRVRALKIVGLVEKKKVVNVTGKRYVEIRDCVDCDFEIFGTTIKLMVTNCRRCTLRTTDVKSLCVTSQATLALSKHVVIDLRRAPQSRISVFAIEQSEHCSLRVANMKNGRLYTDATENTTLVVGSASHCVRTQRPDEHEYLITHVKSDGRIVTERGVRRGLVVLPISEVRGDAGSA